jgi:hypothetical protein
MSPWEHAYWCTGTHSCTVYPSYGNNSGSASFDSRIGRLSIAALFHFSFYLRASSHRWASTIQGLLVHRIRSICLIGCHLGVPRSFRGWAVVFLPASFCSRASAPWIFLDRFQFNLLVYQNALRHAEHRCIWEYPVRSGLLTLSQLFFFGPK